MRVDGFGIFVVLFIMWVVVPAVIGFILYLIVRLGVKHGLRSYDSDKSRSKPPAM
ncbi:hypothetical protein H9639_01525 [Arthrobacter sp. Sa2CUA1]|uniref:Uncharacterized protein n=1 Tax=Arthrobacter gallicola TaxID=2762225 RepID=A0ABR8UN55_9MICC|nr:hypothetical protein [Arthrobacter gallicola]MBD7993978.1 hypothetical protein [Arthrobacter gallicola]